MTFWELVEGRTFYWQMFTLSKGKQILTGGKTKRRPMLMPSGAVFIGHLSVPADLLLFKVSDIGDTWTASFAGVTLTIRMLKEVEDGYWTPAVTKELVEKYWERPG